MSLILHDSIKNMIKQNRYLNRLVILYKEREKKISYGSDNPDKTFFVIRRNAPNAGLFSFVLTNLGWIKYAIDKGYIPIIDMQYYYNTYLTKENVGEINSWEYYFNQPCGYTLSDISKSKNVIISSLNAPHNMPGTGLEKNALDIDIWRKVAKDYMPYTDELKTTIIKQKKALLNGKRTLGVLCRGTDYVAQKPHQHPIQPSIEKVIFKAQDVMEKYGYEQIYLATEDEDVYKKFVNIFGNKLITTSAKRYCNTGRQNINEMTDLVDEKSKSPSYAQYKKGFDYAVNIGILSGCDSLVAGRTSGSYGALLLSNHYEELFLFDLGLYE